MRYFMDVPSRVIMVAAFFSAAAAAWANESATLPAAIATKAPDAESEAVINYCLNISDKAKDARAARQAAALGEMEAELESKIKELEQRREELQTWFEKQKGLQDAAERSLVDIYAAMDPEAAAKQLARLDPRLASSVLHQLKPRLASGILNEMKPEEAAKLVKIIAAATGREKTSQ